VQKRKVW